MRQDDIIAQYTKKNKIESIDELDKLDSEDYDKIFVVIF